MNGSWSADLDLSDDYSPPVTDALADYALAKGRERGLQQALDSIVRQLAEARGEIEQAWQTLSAALDEERFTGGRWL